MIKGGGPNPLKLEVLKGAYMTKKQCTLDISAKTPVV